MADQLELDLGVWPPRRPGRVEPAAVRMVEALKVQGRLDEAGEALAESFIALAGALDRSSGRGASTAMLQTAYLATWEKLTAQVAPIEADGSATYEVELTDDWLRAVDPEPADAG